MEILDDYRRNKDKEQDAQALLTFLISQRWLPVILIPAYTITQP